MPPSFEEIEQFFQRFANACSGEFSVTPGLTEEEIREAESTFFSFLGLAVSFFGQKENPEELRAQLGEHFKNAYVVCPYKNSKIQFHIRRAFPAASKDYMEFTISSKALAASKFWLLIHKLEKFQKPSRFLRKPLPDYLKFFMPIGVQRSYERSLGEVNRSHLYGDPSNNYYVDTFQKDALLSSEFVANEKFAELFIQLPGIYSFRIEPRLDKGYLYIELKEITDCKNLEPLQKTLEFVKVVLDLLAEFGFAKIDA